MNWLQALALGGTDSLYDSGLVRLPQLTQLSLINSPITGVALRQLPQLLDLSICGKSLVNDDDLRALTALRRLDLTNYNGFITPDAVATLPALTELVVEGWHGSSQGGGVRGVPSHVVVRRHGLVRLDGRWKRDL